MKKNTKKLTIGVDLGDKMSHVCILDSKHNIILEQSIRTTIERFTRFFSDYISSTITIEAGTHSPWVSHLLMKLGLTVFVANPSKVTAIWKTHYKSDRRDALMLAQFTQFNPSMLYPIQHRSQEAYNDLAIIKARDALVRVRTTLINHVRGSIKRLGLRIKSCSPETFSTHFQKQMNDFPEQLLPAMVPLVKQISDMTRQIKVYDKQIQRLCDTKYPETIPIQQIQGVAALTALAFVLTLEKADRFPNRRAVGAFLGLVPKRDQSGSTDKQLRITKCGNNFLRRLLVGSAQYILGPFGMDSDLRSYGNRICQRGGKNAKRRAVVAVARKLSVLMHALWSTGEVYEPLRQSKKAA